MSWFGESRMSHTQSSHGCRLQAEMASDALREALSCLVDDYAVWIGEQKARLGSEITGFDDPGKDVIERCEEILRRLREGMGTLFPLAPAMGAYGLHVSACVRAGVRACVPGGGTRDHQKRSETWRRIGLTGTT